MLSALRRPPSPSLLRSPTSIRKYVSRALRTITYLGKVSPKRPVPTHIPQPFYVGLQGFSGVDQYDMMPKIPLLTPETLPKMRMSCKLARQMLYYAGTLVRPGITTEEIDAAVHKKIVEAHAYPSTLGYRDYPKSCCTSINNVLCHGIPDDQPLFDGDIINIDITVYLNGYHGDCSETYFVGSSHPEHIKKLVNAARKARDDSIAQCGPGKPLSIIGKTIDKICSDNGYSTSPYLTGHGVGPIFHADPIVYHTEIDDGAIMTPGMAFTIEPIICEGSPEFAIGEDHWTLFSMDEKWSAQFEHTILITESGHEILTL